MGMHCPGKLISRNSKTGTALRKVTIPKQYLEIQFCRNIIVPKKYYRVENTVQTVLISTYLEILTYSVFLITFLVTLIIFSFSV